MSKKSEATKTKAVATRDNPVTALTGYREMKEDDLNAHKSKVLQSSEYADFKKFVVMKEKSHANGELLGLGAGREFTDEYTGEVSQSPTFLIRPASGLTLEVLGNYQLAQEFVPLLTAGYKDVLKGKEPEEAVKPTGRYWVEIFRNENLSLGAKQIAQIDFTYRVMGDDE